MQGKYILHLLECLVDTNNNRNSISSEHGLYHNNTVKMYISSYIQVGLQRLAKHHTISFTHFFTFKTFLSYF